MPNEISPVILNFFSNNFENILSFIGIFFIALLVFSFLVSSNIKMFEPFIFFFRQFIAVIILPLLVVFMLTGSYVYWQNYFKPADSIEFPRDLEMTTHWIKTKGSLYYVSGEEFHSIDLTGKNDRILFKGQGLIREYQFSPNGENILIVSEKGLFLFNRKNNNVITVDTINDLDSGQNLKDVISNVKWAPLSDRFCYEVVKWSEVSSHQSLVFYDVLKYEKTHLKTSRHHISSLYWNKDGQFLYFLKYAYRDGHDQKNSYEVKVFKIDPKLLNITEDATFVTEEKKLPIEQLKVRGIDLFMENKKRTFGSRYQEGREWQSEDGKVLGVDDKGYLYFIKDEWFHKRLFHIPRVKKEINPLKHNYTDDEYVLSGFKWLPGGKYVVMQHRYFGVIIMDPEARKLGMLTKSKGQFFGWYVP